MKPIFGFLLFLAAQNLIQADKKETEFNLNFQQNDYHVQLMRSQLVRYNKDYVKHISVTTYKYNRTTPVVNVSVMFNVDIGNDLEGVIQVYKFMSNEYRYFPLRMAANACKVLAANVAGAKQMLSCGNFTGCPLVKWKKYHVCNFYPDESKFPPFIPTGDYKIEMQNLYLSNELYVVDAYVSVTRPIVIK